MALAESAAAGTALIICKDPEVQQLLMKSLKPFAVRAQLCDEVLGASRLLNRQKFEAVMIDLRLGAEAFLLIEQLRFSPANRTAVTFAITSGEIERTAKPDSTFVLERPLSSPSVSQIMRAAYGMMMRERRRYFRCPVTIPAFVRAQQQEEFLCQTVNISEGGIAIKTSAVLDPTVPAAVRFTLPERASQVFAETKICWRDTGGLVGLQFRTLASVQKSELQEWLARKLDETLPESVSALFPSSTQSSD